MPIKFRLHIIRLVDVDEFTDGLPYIKVSAGDNSVCYTSGVAFAEKDATKYTFDKEDELSHMLFDVTSNLINLTINVFSKNKLDQITQYAGIGKIKVFTDESPKSEEHTCPLCEDGDDSLEIGALIYSYDIVEEHENVDLGADDFNTASLQLSPREEDYNTRSLQLTPREELKSNNDKSNKHLQVDTSVRTDASYTFDRSAKLAEEDLAKFMGDEVSEGMYDIDSIGPDEELIIAPTLHVQPQHKHLAPHPQPEPQPETNNQLASTQQKPIEASAAGLQPQSVPFEARSQDEWIRAAEGTTPNQINEAIREELDQVSPRCSKITVRLHSVICSSGRQLDASGASAKLSVLPLPNRVVTLRTVAGSSEAQERHGNVSTTLSFGLKTVQLAMGVGDIRSKTFREGACPRLCVEVSLAGSESYTAFAELYLPSLLMDCSGKVLSVPLVSPSRIEGDETTVPVSSTLLLEINPPDLVTGLPEIGPAFAASASNNKSPNKKKTRPATSSKSVVPVSAAAPAAVNLCCNFHGISGAGLEEHHELSSSTTVEVFLTASGCTRTVSLSRCATLEKSPTSLSIKLEFLLPSTSPNLDILELRFRSGPFPEDEFGRVCVPLRSLFKHRTDSALLKRPIGLSMWKANAERGGVFELCKWKSVVSLSLSESEPSRVFNEGISTGNSPRGDSVDDDELLGAQFSPPRSGAPNSALTLTSGSPARTSNNNWLSSPDRLDTRLVATSSYAVKPTAVKSAAGYLSGCVKGFFSARCNGGGTSVPDLNGEFRQGYLSKGTTLFTEVTLLPESLRKKTNSAAPTFVGGGDIDATAEWGKGFSMFVAFALQQRPVPVLQFSLYAERTIAGNNKTVTKNLVGTTCLDLSTLVTPVDSPIVTCLLPLGRTNAPSQQQQTLLLEEKSDISGWLFVGLQFKPSLQGGAIFDDVGGLELSMQNQWAALAAYPTQYCLGLSLNSQMNPGATLKALQDNPRRLTTSSLHVALASLQFSSQRFVADALEGWADCDVTCVIKIGNDSANAVQIMGHVQNDHVVWYKSDAVLRVLRETSVSLILYTYLFRGGYEAGISKASDIIAEASLPVGRGQLDKGVPLNFLLPLRDRKGERCATLSLSVQLTTLADGTSESMNDTFMSAMSNTITNEISTQAVPLRVEFCEGNVAESDEDDRIEPFFECSLLLPEQEESRAGPGYATKARTGFLRISDKLEHWGLDCIVHVPPASVAAIGAATSTLLSASPTKSTFDAAKLSNGACILGVVCRDASKQGCPEIGWARVALPRQLVLQGKPVEQWITLSPPNRNGSPTQQYHVAPSATTANGKHSRMKLRISVDHRDYDAAYSPFGIGAVLMRVVGVHDFRAGMDDELVSARISSHTWPDGSPSDVVDAKGDRTFAQMSAHPANYINEMSIFNQDYLVGSLPVAGGFGDVLMSVKTFTTNTSFSTSFPIMATTTKATDGGDLPPIPLLNLNLAREAVAWPNRPDRMRPQKIRQEPQLKVAAAFVPYVTGKLVLHCTKVELIVSPAEDVPRSAVLKSVDSPLAVRYLLGNNSARFMYSRPFEVNSDNSLCKPLSGPPTLSQADNVTFMEVDTFEVISNSIRRGESMSMMPLFVSLLEQWDLLDPVVERRGQQSCVGVGYVPTAVCYYQALRAAASAPMEPRNSNNTVTSTGAGESNPFAASPWLAAVVDIFDPKTKLKVAVMSLNIQFVMNSIPDHVVRMLSDTVSKSLSDPSVKARSELGLKQSFILADADKSGAVSSEELLQVISDCGKLAKKKTARALTETIGMENAVDLLLQLAGVNDVNVEKVDHDNLSDLVRDIFAQLDVDGDGLVSWWEWKSVLTASILGHNPSSKHMYHLDALVIGMQAAYDAVKTLSPSPPLQKLSDDFQGSTAASHQSVQSVFPFIKLKIQGYDPTSNEAIVCLDENDDDLSQGSVPSKTVSRLHSMVKSLRLTNSILAKRFERALSTAQNLSIDLDQDVRIGGEASSTAANKHGAKLSEIEFLEQRIHDSEHLSEQNLNSFLTAKERSDRLALQLAEMKTLESVMQQTRSHPDLHNFNADLEKEIQSNEEKLKHAQMLRKQRTSEVFSLFRLKALVSKLIMPKVRERRRVKAAAEITRLLKTQAIRKSYLAGKGQRDEAAKRLQGVGRGFLGRQKVREMHRAASKTQGLMRARMARRQTDILRLEKAEKDRMERDRQLFLKKNIAACCIARTMRIFTERLKAEKNSAALRLQSLLKKKLNLKAAKLAANERRTERDLRTEKEKQLAAELAALKEAERLRQEEEDRRHEAALTLARVLGAKSNNKNGKKIHAFLAAQRSLTVIEKPLMGEVVGKWVSFPKSMTTAPDDAEEMDSSFRYFGRGNFGHVQSVDERSRIMEVMFLYNKVEGNKRSAARFELVKLPYDHPVLEFHTSEQKEKGYYVSYTQGADFHWLPMKPFTDRPDRIEDTLGYKVGIKDHDLSADDEDGKEGAMFAGRVVAFDRVAGNVSVLFDEVTASGAVDQEDYAWKSEDIQWLMPPTVSRPATIQEAIGYNVEVNRAQSDAEAYRAARGTVVNIDEAQNKVRVIYAPPPGELYATDAEYITFDSARIWWLQRVSVDQLPSSPRPPNQPSGPSISKLIETHRPADILLTVGHLVEVRSREVGAEPDDMYSGMVIAADNNAGTVRILYDSADKSNVLHQAAASVENSLTEEDEEDWEDLPWQSPDILWVTQDPAATRPPSAIRRPKSLADAVGKKIDVLCREDDAAQGDYFSGTVISVDNEKQTIRVLFDGNENGEDDHEDLAWHSPDIYWLSDESIHAREAEHERECDDGGHGDGNSSIASIPVRPKNFAEVMEWRVKIGTDLQRGEVAAAEATSQSIWVAFNTIPNAPAPVQVKLHWQSPAIEWLKSNENSSAPGSPVKHNATIAAAASASPSSVEGEGEKERPTLLTAAVGWSLEVRAEDADDEVFVGEVGSVDEVKNQVKVLFAGEDGSLQEDDAEYFPFNSPLLTWISAPAGSAAPKTAPKAELETTLPTLPVQAIVSEGTPTNLDRAVGRLVNIVFDYIPGEVVSTSQALQTLNVQLDHTSGTPGSTGPLVLGIPFTSDMIEWDCKI